MADWLEFTNKPKNGSLILAFSPSPIDYGGYGPDSTHYGILELHDDWWAMIGNPAAHEYPITGFSHWQELTPPEGQG